MRKIQTTQVYNAFWNFAYKRQEAFFNRLENKPAPWSDDPIIQKFKFTNAYRATDRVSQYLLKNVIYNSKVYSGDDTVFRILLFKFFNKIETWEYLENIFGEITYSKFDREKYGNALDELMNRKEKIYSAAYIIPSGVSSFGFNKKHKNNLALLDLMMKDKLPLKIAQSKSLEELYRCLLEYPMLGSFLAFQYSIDLNYSELCNFSEMSFVVAGPGARRGIDKCFKAGSNNYEYFIKYVADCQEEEFKKRGLDFKTLFGRPLQLIDCQNLFCETDKYTRVLYPEICSKQSRTRIKQLFKPKNDKIELFLPPKWGLMT